MTRVPNAIEILPKITTAWVGCTSVTDRRQTDDIRQTDGRQHIANVNVSSLKSIWQPCSERHRNLEKRWVTSKPCNGKTVSRTKKLQEKGHIARPFAIRCNAYGERKHTCSSVIGDRSLTFSYRNLGNFRGSYNRNGKLHKKSRFWLGTPLALPLIEGRLS